jgi:hypothetical protein
VIDGKLNPFVLSLCLVAVGSPLDAAETRQERPSQSADSDRESPQAAPDRPSNEQARAALDELTSIIREVGAEGEGHIAVAAMLRRLREENASAIPLILQSFDDVGPLAANWLRNAVETIADRTLQQGEALPTSELEAFINDRRRNPRARRLAYEWLKKADATAPDRLLPGMLQDPSRELRRDAVARLIVLAEKLKIERQPDLAAILYRRALAGAIDDDQVKSIVEPLKEFGETVDLQEHFGFLRRWQLIGPFDNREKKGFAVSYPPETGIDVEATYQGHLGDVSWFAFSTEHDYGILDIAKDFHPHKGAVMYATTEFHTDHEGPIELRLGTPNAWKIWLNGKLLFARDEYHRGTRMDQYRIPAERKPGSNVILLKLCQNEQEQTWAQRYQFQLRISDASGQAVSLLADP